MNKVLFAVLFSVSFLGLLGFSQDAFAVPGDFVGVFASGGDLDTPYDLVYGPDGNLYVASFRSHEILRYDGVTGEFLDVFTKYDITFPAPPPRVEFPRGLAFSPNGEHLYVTSTTSEFHQIFKFDGTTGDSLGVFATLGPAFPAAGCCPGPRDLAFGPDGHLYLTNAFSNEILRFDVGTGDGEVFGQANLFESGLQFPESLAFGPDGNLFVTVTDSSGGSNNILRFDGTTGETLGRPAVPGDGNAQFILSPNIFLNAPRYLVFGPDGNIYVTDGSFNSGRVLGFRGDNGFPLFSKAEFATGGDMASPQGLVFDPNGNLLVSDTFNDRVVMFVGIGNLEQYSLSLSCAPEVTELLLNFPFFHRGGNRIDEQVLLSPLTCPPDFNGVVLLSEVPNGIDAGIFAEVNGQAVPSRFCNLDNLDEPPNFNISIDIDPSTGEVFCKKGTSSIATLSLIPDEFTPPPDNGVVGGEIIPLETTSLLLAGAQSFSWMIPVVLSGIGIGLFVLRKSKNS